jgi:chloramphenicol 3-O phosphotransferase
VISEGCFFRPFPKEIKAYEFCVNLLYEYPVLSVLVTCPIEEARRREKERGNRRIGASEQSLKDVDPNVLYDITVDTFNSSKEECADKIIELLDNPANFTAFKTLWSQYS